MSALTHNLAGTAQDVTIGSFAYNLASQIIFQSRSNDSYKWGGHYTRSLGLISTRAFDGLGRTRA